MRAAPLQILTIGHSTHDYDVFLALLRGAGVTAIADVRTYPFSRRVPQFDRDTLAARLRADGIAHVHLGDALGGRPRDPALRRGGVVDYERVAATPAFAAGLDRVIAGAGRHRIALMCAERDPRDCHRGLLVGRALDERGIDVAHILPDGRIEPHADVVADLLRLTHDDPDQIDLFASPAARIAHAYRARMRLSEPEQEP